MRTNIPRRSIIKSTLFLVFFISGSCGLLYQMVWLRLAYAHFGINTQVMSIVVSVFMLGLALGSWVAGRYLIPAASKRHLPILYVYALVEAGIGMSAFIVPAFFKAGHTWLLSLGSTDSVAYLTLSALVIVISILPWCFLMGTTIPLIVEFINTHLTKDEKVFSFLYLANTIGAIVGSIVSAFILIELVGFKGTLMTAALLNGFIVVISVIIALSLKKQGDDTFSVGSPPVATTSPTPAWERKMTLPLLFMTGLTSMGLEVVWTRLYTPILKTTVYSFAFILILYLLGTVCGLWWYRYQSHHMRTISTRSLLLCLVFISFAQIIITDPRYGLGIIGISISILTFSCILGYLTPKQIDTLSQGDPRSIGTAYSINIIGCIIGPLLASYLLLPVLGAKVSIILLCVPLIAFLIYTIQSTSNLSVTSFMGFSTVTAALIVLALTSTTYEEGVPYPIKKIKRDYSATVTAYANPDNARDKLLVVNGAGMTSLVSITKHMAHLPLALLRGTAKKTMIICFGMGTTFRSSLSWGLDTTAVELTPSVVDLFPFFFSDAAAVRDDPNAHIVIDDGRRYLERRTDQYDLIAIDPPPPVEAAGSSLLYSSDFYRILKDRLTDRGILQQWYYDEPGPTLYAAARSLANSFPYVDVYPSSEGWGFHFLASKSPMQPLTPEEFVRQLPPKALADLMEWAKADGQSTDPIEYARAILAKKTPLDAFLSPDTSLEITDDRPFNEYYILREFAGAN